MTLTDAIFLVLILLNAATGLLNLYIVIAPDFKRAKRLESLACALMNTGVVVFGVVYFTN